jgi:hypothetical protein
MRPQPTRHRSAGFDPPAPSSGCSAGLWTLIAAGTLLIAAIAIRFASLASVDEPRFDEVFSLPAISAIVREGWTARTALDFEETKGPGFIWPYAAFGAVVGDDLPRLRWLSIAAFAMAALPLSSLAWRSGIRGPGVVAVVLLYALLPQQALLGQLVMSEPLFVTLSLCAVWAFWYGFSPAQRGVLDADPRPAARARTALGALLVFALLTILAHSRVHAAALGLAFMVVALQRDGWRAWPWLLAVLLAGAARLPLAWRWGGLVGPAFREQHQLGQGTVQWSNVVYLLAAVLPLTGVFLLCLQARPAGGRRREIRGSAQSGPSQQGGLQSPLALYPRPALIPRLIPTLSAAGAGLLLGLLASPVRASLLPPTPGLVERAPEGLLRYLGPVASAWRLLERKIGGTAGEWAAVVLVALLAALGAASLAELARRAWASGRADRPSSDDARLLGQLTVITLLGGMAMYGLAQSLVVDRYLVPWAMLLPVLWWVWLPRWLAVLWGMLLSLACAAWLTKWL